MPKYRYTQVEFWDDADVEKMSFEEKSFFIYLLTNPRTTQCGIYNFSLGIAAIQLNLSKEKVRELLDKLINYGKVIYNEENSELMIVNWYKYNVTSSRNTHICINKELKKVKTKSFIARFY